MSEREPTPARDPAALDPAALDPRGLIEDAFAIEGIVEPDCRSIFLDWALGLPEGADSRAMIAALVAHHGGQPADHPMMRVLREGLEREARPGRRSSRRRA